jgi:hypothetical protein
MGKAVKKLSGSLPAKYKSLVEPAQKKLKKGQKYIRGLFSGGTFCYETVLLLSEALGKVYSNTPIKKDEKIPNVWRSLEHTVIDLGDDLFTQGRPHPMIDFRLRNERILQEAHDPETAVILLDIVLGYGSNMDPAGEFVPAILEAQFIASGSDVARSRHNPDRQQRASRAPGSRDCLLMSLRASSASEWVTQSPMMRRLLPKVSL